jgi:hypothetical protein
MSADNTPLTIAYVSDGSLYLWRQGEPSRKVESAFARQVQERAAEVDRKHAWKGKGRDERYRQQVWGRGGEAASEYHYVQVSDVCAEGDQQELIRCSRDGKPELLIPGVVAFDLTQAGRLVCSDGRSLFELDDKGSRILLLRAPEISAVCVLG